MPLGHVVISRGARGLLNHASWQPWGKLGVPQNPSEGLSRGSILKKSRSRGAGSEGYARPRAPSPNRLFSVPSAKSGLTFILFFHFSDKKTRSRRFFAPRISKKSKNFWDIIQKRGGGVPGWSFCYLVGWEDNNTGVWVSKVWNPTRNLKKAAI